MSNVSINDYFFSVCPKHFCFVAAVQKNTNCVFIIIETVGSQKAKIQKKTVQFRASTEGPHLVRMIAQKNSALSEIALNEVSIELHYTRGIHTK